MAVPKHPYLPIYIQVGLVIINIIFGLINFPIQGNEWVVALNFGVASFITILGASTFFVIRKTLANIKQFNAEVERFNETYFY